jgi:ABC-type bacteriocin/lantibiotic exporter with double-glycine peptidase domain
MGYLLGPVQSIATEIAARNQKKVDVSRVYEVLTDHEGVEDLRSGHHFPISHGRIEFQNVSYVYKDMLILDHIDLMVEAGQKVGIIGPSGGGKTTLLKLLPLFIEPTTGRIMIDDYDIQTVSLKELRQKIVWISQNPQLFKESILDNLLDGDAYRQITPEELNLAIDAANVNEFAGRLPMGLDSPAGEGGNSLSGGQKQRIAIARGLIKNAPIVCMDEPTAALDAKSENTIRDSISKLIAGKTVLMVTHRKALLSLMDVIYVMDGGKLHRVEEFGGLNSYLRMISDTDMLDQQRQQEAARQQQAQEQLARLQAEKEELLKELGEKQSAPAPAANSGTVYIDH